MPSTKDPLTHVDEALRSIAVADVRDPSIPMAVFNQQGNDIVAFLAQNPDVKQRLAKVGLPGQVLERLPLAMRAAQAAESAWQAVFSPRNPQDLVALEQSGARLRGDVVAALRWNLREDRIAQGTLDSIQDGVGAADLAQDLDALAVLVEQHADSFEDDRTFDAKERATVCRNHAKELRDSVSGARADLSRAEAKELRDRAFTYADDLLDDVREAARYAFRGDAELLARFQDRYLVQAARRSRRRAKALAPASPEQPVEA